MQHESNHASRGTEQDHGNGQADLQQAAPKDGIRPGMTVPPTVLVTALDNGTLILQGRPDGPRVWLHPDDAVPLKRELAAAFGRTRLAAIGDDQGEAR